MSGFTKLVPEIVQSSIWNEPSDIRIVWITMLAVKDQDGYVRGDAKTIARLANVPLDAAKQALEMFQQPDPSSHTPDHDGKRIVAMPGGWLILNADKYRLREDAIREQTRLRVSRFRSKNSDVTQCNVTETLPSVSVSASASASEEGSAEGRSQTPEASGPDLQKLALAAHAAFGKAVLCPAPVVVANISDLLDMGHTPDDLAALFSWRKTTMAKYAPQSPSALTDPTRWEQWQGLLAKEHTGALPECAQASEDARRLAAAEEYN